MERQDLHLTVAHHCNCRTSLIPGTCLLNKLISKGISVIEVCVKLISLAPRHTMKSSQYSGSHRKTYCSYRRLLQVKYVTTYERFSWCMDFFLTSYCNKVIWFSFFFCSFLFFIVYSLKSFININWIIFLKLFLLVL